jgi:hypothetical protein
LEKIEQRCSQAADMQPGEIFPGGHSLAVNIAFWESLQGLVPDEWWVMGEQFSIVGSHL